MKVSRLVFAFGLLSGVFGCDRGRESSPPVTVTNVVTVTREVVVTNVVTAAEAEVRAGLSARKTTAYRVSAAGFDETRLRSLLAETGARVIECGNGAVATVEATEAMAKLLNGAVATAALRPEDKIAADAGERVRILPLSTIDVSAVAEAVRAAGGEVVQVVTTGRPCVRAKISYKCIRKLAARGDVRRIERDGK